jgi:hypothetical protein
MEMGYEKPSDDRPTRVGLRSWIQGQARTYLQNKGAEGASYLASVRHAFDEKLTAVYWDQVRPVVSDEVKQADLARKYDVAPATISRWVKAECLPHFQEFCLLAACEDAEFPHGWEAAAIAYAAALDFVSQHWKPQFVGKIEPDEIIPLYHLWRAPSYWKGKALGNRKLIKEGIGDVKTIVVGVHAIRWRWGWGGLESLAHDLLEEWTIVDASIPYEPF